jgi:hypothetical protein
MNAKTSLRDLYDSTASKRAPSRADEGLFWCFCASGGTVGPFKAAAEIALAETALYFAGANDLVLLPAASDRGQTIRNLEDCRDGAERGQLSTVVAGSDTDRARWMADNAELLVKLSGGRSTIFSSSGAAQRAFARAGGRALMSGGFQAMGLPSRRQILERLILAGVARPFTSVCTDQKTLERSVIDIIRRCGAAVVKVNQEYEQPGTCLVREEDIAASIGRYRADSDHPVIVEAFEDVIDATNVQYFLDGNGCGLLGWSIQLVALNAATRRLQHCGNIQPGESAVEPSSFDRLSHVAHHAASAVHALGFRGPVGIDLIGTADGRWLVVDINLRINASTFLHAFRAPTRQDDLARAFFFGVSLPNAAEPARLIRQLTEAGVEQHRHSGCSIKLCFTPVVLAPGDRLAVNLLARGPDFRRVLTASRDFIEAHAQWFSFPGLSAIEVMRRATYERTSARALLRS